MAYDEELAARAKEIIEELAEPREQKMFGGIAFMVNDHMCVGPRFRPHAPAEETEEEVARLSTAKQIEYRVDPCGASAGELGCQRGSGGRIPSAPSTRGPGTPLNL